MKIAKETWFDIKMMAWGYFGAFLGIYGFLYKGWNI